MEDSSRNYIRFAGSVSRTGHYPYLSVPGLSVVRRPLGEWLDSLDAAGDSRSSTWSQRGGVEIADGKANKAVCQDSKLSRPHTQQRPPAEAGGLCRDTSCLS